MNICTQIPDIGIYAAHITHKKAGTGATVFVAPEGCTCGVDVRGGAPATRETDLLRPEELVQKIHAVMLSGGSAYGLNASTGAIEALEAAGIGLDVGVGKVPLVTSACLFDLACGSATSRPTAQDGAQVTTDALTNKTLNLAEGNVGAGTGCTVGKFAGPHHAMKSGFGMSAYSQDTLVVAAFSAVNAVGNVCDPHTHHVLAGAYDRNTHNFLAPEDFLVPSLIKSTDSMHNLHTGDMVATETPVENPLPLRSNTTISCVVTNAILSKTQATKVAQIAADAYAHAIYPTHTTNDGDTIFVMASNKVELRFNPEDIIGFWATKALEEAIASGVRQAKSAYGYLAAHDLT